MARGACRLPCRPTNSLRSQVKPAFAWYGASTSKKATHSAKSLPKLLRASKAPLTAERSVTMCGAVFERMSPSTHST